MSRPPLTALDIKAALRATFRQPEWALFFEVSDGTGAAARRRADAVAMSLWPSRGLELRAIEIKVSRSDLAAELRNPVKAEAIAQYCDSFWLAVPTGLIGDTDDIPAPWGILTVGEKGHVRTAKKAVSTPADQALTRPFMASLLRASAKADEGEVQARIRQETERIREEMDARRRRDVEREVRLGQDKASKAAELFAKIEAATGASAYQLLDDSGFLATVTAVHAAGVDETWSGLGRVHKDLVEAARRADATAALLGEHLIKREGADV